MFCNQCEQTTRGVACTTRGICGKDEETAALQDVLTWALQDLAVYAGEAQGRGSVSKDIKELVLEALFTTLTNVNFDPDSIYGYIKKVRQASEELKQQLNGDKGLGVAGLDYSSKEALIAWGVKQGLPVSRVQNPDVRSLQEILLYGLRGVAAYAYHALKLGEEDQAIYEFIFEVLPVLGSEKNELDYWIGLVLKCGEINIRAMEILDRGNTNTLGHPEPTAVPLGHKAGKCILVSGHDLLDLKRLLEATAGLGITVYTHGEMLPAHGYPELKNYEHFYGHYGRGWQNQQREFAAFPGPILMTTNCIQKPGLQYGDRIFTTGPVAWPGVLHLPEGEFKLLIDKALNTPGFEEDLDAGQVMVGFARQAVLSVAGQVIDAVKAGKIKHFFLVGGCDGVNKERSYYSDFVEQAPADTIILTLACGKFRFFDKQLGDIEGIPRLLDIGQCNDAYSAVQIALALAQAFECGVNDLPLSMILSWYEQKAVSILLSLFYLGIKDIRLGPTLPAFISPNVLQVLVDTFAIKPITKPEQDLAAIMGGK
ncbi:MAG: hydroxylamine reductase [Syntrophomonadaceae bacterium]